MTATNINDRIYRSYVETTNTNGLEFAKRVTYGDTFQTDSFGRLRVSLPNVVYDNYEIQGKKTLVWNELNAGGASSAHIANQSAVGFTTTAASGDRAVRSSKKLTLYTPGTSILVFLTGVMGTGAANSRQRMGIFNDNNGIFFEQKDGVMGVVIRSNTSGSVVDNRVDISDWNIDTCDGSGCSGVTLDFTKTQIFVIDLEWLGVGRVRMGFVHEGKFLLVHEFVHNNQLTTVYMKSAILPLTYEVVNTGASAARTDFRQICSSVIVEGQETVSKLPRTVNNGVTARATTTTTGIPLISLRLQTATVGQCMLRPSQVEVMSIGNRDHIYEIHYGGTLESSSWVNNSGFGAYDISATHITGSTKIATLYSASTVRADVADIFRNLLWLNGDLSGVPDSISVVARSIGGGGTALAGIDYEEFG
jgi:hypothetical protein